VSDVGDYYGQSQWMLTTMNECWSESWDDRRVLEAKCWGSVARR